ncbi:MAG: helix-turn-helix transcriptional regulator [Verrucomicrobia bacterium]|nr:helix-turn-helix transcriptional regulator [Verrucomicrobiota bacterium]
MPIMINLDVMLAKRKMRSKELAEAIGITEQNLSILKTGKAKALRFATLEVICKVLECQPGDLLEYHSKEAVAKLICPAKSPF